MLSQAELFTFRIEAVTDPLHVVTLTGREACSELFTFTLVFASTSELAIEETVGRRAELVLRGPEGARTVAGLVSRLEHVGEDGPSALYEATVAPIAYRLALRRGCRVFQSLTIPEIIDRVLRDAGLSDDEYRMAFGGTYAKVEHRIQYRESDWDFVLRIAHEEGFYCFFDHSEGRGLLTFVEATFENSPIVGSPLLPHRGKDGALAPGREHVRAFRYGEAMHATRVATRSHQLRNPHFELSAAVGERSALEVYDYPGEDDLVDPRQASRRLEERARLDLARQRSHSAKARGESTSVRIVPGASFRLTEHTRESLNETYVVTAVEHEGSQPHQVSATEAPRYVNRFAAVPARVGHRPDKRPKPSMRGMLTAVVVGPSSEEVHTDELGRVRVKFRWDRSSGESEPCWVRVKQTWAGQGYGAMFIPRVGQEVLVDFLDGEPDLPVIVGSVYHAINVPPHSLPDARAISGIRTASTPGAGGFHELRFDDRAGGEEVYLRSQRDLSVEVLAHRETTVGGEDVLEINGSRRKSVGADETVNVAGAQIVTVGRDRTDAMGGDHLQSVGSNEARSIGGNATTSIGANSAVSVGANATEIVGANLKLEVGGAHSVRVRGREDHVVDGDRRAVVRGSQTELVRRDVERQIEGSLEERVTLDAALVAGRELELVCGGGRILIDRAGRITIEGADLIVKAPGPVRVEGSRLNVAAKGPVVVRSETSVKIRGSGIDMN